MLKLELDWAGDETPDVRADEVGFDDNVIVEYDGKPGPNGWPTVAVYVPHVEGEPAYMASMVLDGWLQSVYGANEDEAQELADFAETV